MLGWLSNAECISFGKLCEKLEKESCIPTIASVHNLQFGLEVPLMDKSFIFISCVNRLY